MPGDTWSFTETMGGAVWFDTYDQEETLLLDNFTGHFMPYTMLLRVLDGYPMMIPTKGGHTFAAWKNVLITSIWHPREWYDLHNLSELMGRLDERGHVCMIESKRAGYIYPVSGCNASG